MRIGVFRSFRQIARHHSRGQNRFRICLRTLIAKTTSLCYSEPNIIGSAQYIASIKDAVYSSDALELGTDPAFPRRDETGNEGSNALYRTLILKANKYNGIFGSSDTVQPAGLYAQMLIRAYQA